MHTASRNRPLPTIRSAQLILLALAGGVLAFAVVAGFLRLSRTEGSSEIQRLLPVVVGGLAVSLVVVYALLRRLCFSRVAAVKAEAKELVKQGVLPPPLFTLTVIGAALAEGVGLMGSVTVLLGGAWSMLAAPALAVALILVQLPTRTRVEALLARL